MKKKKNKIKPVLSCFPLPPEERRSTEVRSIACDDVPVCVASLLFVCFNSIGSSQVLEVFVLFVGKGLNQKFTAPIPLPNFLNINKKRCMKTEKKKKKDQKRKEKMKRYNIIVGI